MSSRMPSWGQPQQPQQPYGPGPWNPQQPPKKSRRGWVVVAAGLGVAVVIAAAVGGSGDKKKNDEPPTQKAQAVTLAPTTDTPTIDDAPVADDPTTPAADTITYVVKGSSGADVTYGPSGSEVGHTGPMKKTAKLNPHAMYYSITSQLQGGGKTTCQILVNGKVVSTGTAQGDYRIASCEIVSDFDGGWQNAN